jgi:hypothetical protein
MSETGLKWVRVLFVGNHEVMVKIIENRLPTTTHGCFPYGNAWGTLDRLRPAYA